MIFNVIWFVACNPKERMRENTREKMKEKTKERRKKNNPNDIPMITIPLQFWFSSNVPHARFFNRSLLIASEHQIQTNNFQLHFQSNIYSFNYLSHCIPLMAWHNLQAENHIHFAVEEFVLWTKKSKKRIYYNFSLTLLAQWFS